MNSISDVFTTVGRTQVNVIWELIAEAIEGGRTRYTNRVTIASDDVFMDFLAAHTAELRAGGDRPPGSRRRSQPAGNAAFRRGIGRRAMAKAAAK